MAFIVRESTEADAYDVARVNILSWQSAYRDIIPDDYLNNLNIDKRAERLKKDLVEYAGKTYWFAMAYDGKIIGTMAIGQCRDDDKPAAGEVMAIYLLPEYWSMGLGKKSMDFAVKTLRESSFDDIYVWVLEENVRARKFYEKYGFVYDGTRKEINLGKPLIEIRYVLGNI